MNSVFENIMEKWGAGHPWLSKVKIIASKDGEIN